MLDESTNTSPLPHINIYVSTYLSASFRNPLTWLRESLTPNVRQKNTEEELEAARKAEAEKGEGSIFDVVAETVREESKPGEETVMALAKSQKKVDQVRSGYTIIIRRLFNLSITAQILYGKLQNLS